uniref:Uncharacterized protein n=1 Tax=Rhizophora mucronata TaxID=61149 RepID=A0A2P2Q2R3_RHIMU
MRLFKKALSNATIFNPQYTATKLFNKQRIKFS